MPEMVDKVLTHDFEKPIMKELIIPVIVDEATMVEVEKSVDFV